MVEVEVEEEVADKVTRIAEALTARDWRVARAYFDASADEILSDTVMLMVFMCYMNDQSKSLEEYESMTLLALNEALAD